ncbi:MAG TPA: hypothetical protein VN699_13760 [Pirellulales bacterium]|nr:hypothetical protein [Pirellulales bacterium]
MNRRLIGTLPDIDHSSPVKHYFGLPPNLTGDRDERTEMKSAALLVIEEKSDGVFLCRYAADSSYAGDTWHINVEEAKQQASFEYPHVRVQWEGVPSEFEDAVSFGMARMRGEAL